METYPIGSNLAPTSQSTTENNALRPTRIRIPLPCIEWVSIQGEALEASKWQGHHPVHCGTTVKVDAGDGGSYCMNIAEYSKCSTDTGLVKNNYRPRRGV